MMHLRIGTRDVVVEVNRRFIRHGSPGRPPRLSHSSCRSSGAREDVSVGVCVDSGQEAVLSA